MAEAKLLIRTARSPLDADFLLVDAEGAPEAVAAHPARLAVVKNGRVVSQAGDFS